MELYTVYVNSVLLESLPKGARRQLVLKFLRLLSFDPQTAGDFVELDGTGRDVQIKIVGKDAVSYWPDHAVRAIMVVKVAPADR